MFVIDITLTQIFPELLKAVTHLAVQSKASPSLQSSMHTAIYARLNDMDRNVFPWYSREQLRNLLVYLEWTRTAGFPQLHMDRLTAISRLYDRKMAKARELANGTNRNKIDTVTSQDHSACGDDDISSSNTSDVQQHHRMMYPYSCCESPSLYPVHALLSGGEVVSLFDCVTPEEDTAAAAAHVVVSQATTAADDDDDASAIKTDTDTDTRVMGEENSTSNISANSSSSDDTGSENIVVAATQESEHEESRINEDDQEHASLQQQQQLEQAVSTASRGLTTVPADQRIKEYLYGRKYPHIALSSVTPQDLGSLLQAVRISNKTDSSSSSSSSSSSDSRNVTAAM